MMNITDSMMNRIASPGGKTPIANVVRAVMRTTGKKHSPRDVLAQLNLNYKVEDGFLIGWSLR